MSRRPQRLVFFAIVIMLSDGAKIALATSIPAGTFTVLFAIATYVRRRRLAGAQTTFSQVTVPPISPPRPLQPRPLPTPPESPGLAQRKLSFAPPAFAETAITVRRLSTDPQKDDAIQRVNSISSSLNVQVDPTSDLLPLGGRKSSVSSFLSADDVGQGQRRLSVRRVSAGGAEDVLDIPCAQAETENNAQEVVQTPITPGHPTDPPLPVIPPLEPPPSPRSARRHRRPDSITITLRAKPGLRSAPLQTAPIAKSAMEPTTGTPYTAKSPWTASTADQSAGVVFEAWRGFPTGDTRIYEHPEVEDIRSPTRPNPNTVRFDEEPDSSNRAASTTFSLAIPVSSERPRSATLPRGPVRQASKRLSLQSLVHRSPPASPTTTPQSQNKVTYLSDVVKELEENPHLRLTQEDLGKSSSLSHLTELLKAEAASHRSQAVPTSPRVSPLPPVIPLPDGLSTIRESGLSSDFLQKESDAKGGDRQGEDSG